MDFYIHLCKHCGTDCTGIYCNQCKTAEQRREMDRANKELKPDYVCKVCDLGWYSTFSRSFSDGLIERIKVDKPWQ